MRIVVELLQQCDAFGRAFGGPTGIGDRFFGKRNDRIECGRLSDRNGHECDRIVTDTVFFFQLPQAFDQRMVFVRLEMGRDVGDVQLVFRVAVFLVIGQAAGDT